MLIRRLAHQLIHLLLDLLQPQRPLEGPLEYGRPDVKLPVFASAHELAELAEIDLEVPILVDLAEYRLEFIIRQIVAQVAHGCRELVQIQQTVPGRVELTEGYC